VAWIASQPSGKYSYNIVNGSPFVSPVPLEELKGFALRFDSTATQRSMPQVRIFEYVK
jgi:hypothetical protein